MAENDPKLTDVAPPDLNVEWQAYGPSMTGDPRGIQPPPHGHPEDPGVPVPPPPPSQPPPVNKYHVAPGTLEGAANTILASANTAVDAYDAARNYLNANKSWMFSVAEPDVLEGTQYHPDLAGDGIGWINGGNPATDPHPDFTAQWTAAIDNILLAAADSIRLAGSYLDSLNNAGQFYTKGDQDSQMPTFDPKPAPPPAT